MYIYIYIVTTKAKNKDIKYIYMMKEYTHL